MFISYIDPCILNVPVMTWGIYFLASHPDVQDRLYDELIMVLGDKDVDPDTFKELT